MNYTFQTIIDNQDLLQIVAKYLPLETKIILQRITNRKLFKFYDFNSDDYKLKTLKDLFEIDDDIVECVNYERIFDKYEEVERRKFVVNNLAYFDIPRIQNVFSNIPLEEFVIRVQYSHRSWHHEFQNECEKKLREIIQKSIFHIRIKVFTQMVEESNLDISLDPDSLIQDNRYADEITKYYLENIHNLDIFCEKCGVFGHDSLSKICVLYNKDFENQEVMREAHGILENILCKVEIISERIAKNREKGLIGCKGKWCNRLRSDRCSFSLCKNCCKNKECKYHGKKG